MFEILITNLPAIIAALGGIWATHRNSTKQIEKQSEKIENLKTEINGKMTELNIQTGLRAGLEGEKRGMIEGKDSTLAAAVTIIDAAKTAAQQVLNEAAVTAAALKETEAKKK